MGVLSQPDVFDSRLLAQTTPREMVLSFLLSAWECRGHTLPLYTREVCTHQAVRAGICWGWKIDSTHD